MLTDKLQRRRDLEANAGRSLNRLSEPSAGTPRKQPARSDAGDVLLLVALAGVSISLAFVVVMAVRQTIAFFAE